ncbi:retinol dehydrogenase 14 [Schistocerca americana]|uniref:retinol dehydrogenase 14 n=1 Tax=Schistocerca americana TaxID=7009 RepID=UPI001F4FBA9C|nr:retinol dehydrogenase 14 [Schistocerca americana]XP_046993302.1 retinol dehydrogenase 14 [Schistocerca americana]XP_046993303.1 retinol dehydrogenase 14 [Schistocerca americana]XP_047112538.1 retinol dehydrogenase 14 [Schistocerca piceifrons]XP_047112539.1 retinol dehydrogenase 14 [Schistocerca piceifrons]XP_047112540.1 retinol dehydrogenase 14 [Schistocerca piceifrons]XP_049956223.1 retinol dehydrogenase 14 [Schistocerca serialis cubense]XP_049956224.1 retinol dehydrogenase 14 [Schistoce
MFPCGACVLCYIVLGGLALLILGLFLLKVYVKVTCGVCTSTKRMEGKTVIITGANSGIGKETAFELARRGARVIMACRSIDVAKKIRDEIVAATGNESVFVQPLDLSSLESVRKFATAIKSSEKRLDVLIHNAGCAHAFGPKATEDGLELTMATNHYGPFLLTHLLIDLLKQSVPSRIVVVASELYRFAKVDLQNVNPLKTFPGYLYYVSKYANIMFTLELARRLEGTGVTVNCLHPGMIDSGIFRNVPFPLNLPIKLIAKLYFKTPEQGAQTTLHLAISEEVEGVSGKYYMDCMERGLSQGVQDMAAAKKLWELSEDLVKLQPSDPHL